MKYLVSSSLCHSQEDRVLLSSNSYQLQLLSLPCLAALECSQLRGPVARSGVDMIAPDPINPSKLVIGRWTADDEAVFGGFTIISTHILFELNPWRIGWEEEIRQRPLHLHLSQSL